MDISAIHALHESWCTLKGVSGVNAAAVEKIDTSGVQIILALLQQGGKDFPVSEPSEPLCQAFELLALKHLLPSKEVRHG